MAESRESEARRLVAKIRESIDVKPSDDGTKGRRQALIDRRRLVLDVVTLQTSMGEPHEAMLWVQGMKQADLTFDCLLAIADELSKAPEDRAQ